MKKTVWHKGPPPSVGWWPASRYKIFGSYRWWNGSAWSVAVFESYNKISVSRASKLKAIGQREIKWTERPDDWPEWSRT